MNAVAITLIGVVGSGLISAFFVMIRMMASRFDRLEDEFGQFEENLDDKFGSLTADVHALEIRMTDKFTGELKALEIRMTDKFTGELKALDAKFTGELKALDAKFTGELKAQGERIDRVHDVLRLHGERLARIEFKLDIDPPAEAA